MIEKLNQLSWAFRKPRRALGVLYHVGMGVNQEYYKNREHTGTYVIDQDWDNLIILDGCRYDMFKKVCNLEGSLGSRISHGSNSAPFLNKNFSGKRLHDSIYITANPHVSGNIPVGTFYTAKNALIDHWDEELETVPPERMVEITLDYYEKFPNKRMITHWMQPHYPFIGPSGGDLQTKGIPEYDQQGNRVNKQDIRTVWRQLKFGEVDLESVWKAYRENLEIALQNVEDLVEELPGKTVITSDHGNLVGDWIGPLPTRGFGHPQNLHVEELVKVPWFTLEYEERRDVSSEKPIGRGQADSSIVSDRLESLGYK